MTSRIAHRRGWALIVASVIVASASVAVVAAPVAAQSCNGRAATVTDNGPGDQDPEVGVIKGTNANDVIVGTTDIDVIDGLGGRDLICGRQGDDVIDGGNRRDIIFGGSGDDVIEGGKGSDDLFGYRGDDRINGGRGNDFINGGPNKDECRQQAGRGRVKNCERADLRIRLIGPTYANPEPGDKLRYRVRVTNRGPAKVPYDVSLDIDPVGGATCDGDGLSLKAPKLRPGRSRTHAYLVECEDGLPDGKLRVFAVVDPFARDPRLRNNSRQLVTDLD